MSQFCHLQKHRSLIIKQTALWLYMDVSVNIFISVKQILSPFESKEAEPSRSLVICQEAEPKLHQNLGDAKAPLLHFHINGSQNVVFWASSTTFTSELVRNASQAPPLDILNQKLWGGVCVGGGEDTTICALIDLPGDSDACQSWRTLDLRYIVSESLHSTSGLMGL